YAAGDHWTDEQILYQAQHPFDYSASAGTLTDYWRCDEGTGTTVGGYANDLTLSNALAWSTQPVVKMTTGLVGWWKMDDNADNTSVRDYSRYGNTGTFSDATGNPFTSAHTTAGQIGSAMTFDGVDDYVSVGDPVSGSLDMASNFTITAWVKMSDPASNFDAIINKHSNAGNPSTHGTGYLITSHSTANGGVRAYLRDGTNASTIDGPSGYDIRDGNWHFVVLRADKSGNGIVYVDGVAGTLVSLITIGNLSNVTNFIIGWTITTYYFPGLIDDVRIYNYARSAEQIKQDYERGLRGRE
ncbi:LamG domain-containing protein, partial [Patescibacteria group bacterium]|nr:LamG domain-containing protein [Patescibacteria group bacterium]